MRVREMKTSLFPRRSIASGARPGRAVNLPIKHRPVLAEHVSTRSGRQVQTKAQERISDSAVLVRPIDVRQSLGHQRPGQPRPVYDIASVIAARDEDARERILHGVVEAWSDLRIETRIL